MNDAPPPEPHRQAGSTSRNFISNMSHPTTPPASLPIGSNPEIDHKAIDQRMGPSEAVEAEITDTQMGGSSIIDSGSSNIVLQEAKARDLEPVTPALGDIEARNTKAEGGAVSVALDKRQPEAKHGEVEGCERGADGKQYQRQEEGNILGAVTQADEAIAPEEENVNRVNQEEAIVKGEEEEEEEEEEETMDPSEISRNLYTALQAIEDNGTFATSGNYPTAINPVLSVNSIGIVGLPLSNRDAQAIIAVAAQAPFGHGERTVVNTDVRDTWELQPNQVQFMNPAWKDWIEKEVLAKAANDLGIANPTQTVKCELYKVLLYKEGGHFLPHKDTEKAPGMFGTLMIVLPSLYTGGAVQLSHAGMEKKFDFGGPTSITNTSYAAWYTDILHSVLPVTSGYRFALSYNMIHKGPAAVPRLPNIQSQIEELRLVLRTWNRNTNDPDSPKLVGWMLDHQYSEQALNSQKIEALKGADKCRGLALLDLAKELGFEFYLAQMEYQKTGTVVDNGYGYGYRRRRGYRGYGYDSDGDPEGKTMDDIIEESLTAKNFINCKTGHSLPQDFNPSFEQDDCIPAGYWDEEEPDTKNYEGYTGNAEATLDYWYKRTAIILWPSKTHADSVDHLTYRWDRVVFLDRTLWTQAEIYQGKRLKFAEGIIAQLVANPVPTPAYAYAYGPRALDPKEQRYADKLMEFALEEKRLDLFLKMVDITKSTDIAKMTRAANEFGVEGVRNVAQQCISNTKGVENQLRAAIQLYHQRPDELKIIVKRLVDATSISKEVKPESFRGLADLMGPELFQTCILQNLKRDYSNTSFWISLWQQYPVVDWVNDTLPEVVHAHKPHLTRDADHLSINPQTLPLLYKVVELGRADLASEIIQKIQDIPKPADAEFERLKGQYSIALMAIARNVVQILERHNISITTEPYANFIKKTFVNSILPTLGPRPRPGQDFRLQTMRAAGHPPCCPNCSMVDIFLSDPWQQTASYHLVWSLREHLEQKLRGRRNINVRNDPLPSRMYSRRNTVPGTITVTKVGLSAADVIEKWDRVRAQIERSFFEIGSERVRKEIFGGLFPIIQMGIREYGMGWGKEMEEAVVLGEQEEQQAREQRLQGRARIIAEAMDNHRSEAGPSNTNHHTPQALLGEADGNADVSSGEVQITGAGKKRKRPMQVIDLTDE